MKDRFAQLSQREQFLIMIMVGLLAILIIMLGVIRPLMNMRTNNIQALQTEQTTLRLVEQVTGQQTTVASATPAQIGQIVTRSARASGFQLATFGEADGNRYLVKLENIKASDVFSWLYKLERDNKIIVAESQIRKDSRNGTVSATIFFIQG